MALTDFDKILKEYQDHDNDFGFSAVSEQEYKNKINEAVVKAEDYASEITAEEYKAKMLQLEKMIVPFLKKLHSTGDKEYIYWPNRKPVIEKQIEEILKITRG
jgi:hypothetical protein